MGRRDFMKPPIDLGFFYPDNQQSSLPVFLVVKHVDEPIPPTTRHWSILWEVRHTHPKNGTPRAFRTLHLTCERDKRGLPCKHLTNWGPITKTLDNVTIQRSRFIPLGNISLQGRIRLEEIAKLTPVRIADEGWNDHNWIIAVLQAAVRDRVLQINLDAVKASALDN